MWKNNSLDEVQKGLLEHNIIAIGGEIDSDNAYYFRESMLRLLAKGAPPIEVQITSSGGSTEISLTMYDALRSYPNEVTGIVYGYAHSAAVTVLQGCKKRVAMKHSVFIIHNVSKSPVSLDIFCDSKKLAELKEELEKIQDAVNKIFTEKTKKSLEEIKSQCAEERKMTAQEAKEFGLIDEVR